MAISVHESVECSSLRGGHGGGAGVVAGGREEEWAGVAAVLSRSC